MTATKIKNLSIITLLFMSYYMTAQIKPILTTSNVKKTTYSSYSHPANKKLVENQSYNLNQSLRNIQLIENNNENHIKKCLKPDSYSKINPKKTIFFIEYVINNKGQIISSSLINYGVKINLSSSQIECILTNSMQNSYKLNNAPKITNTYYIIVNKRYKL